MSNIVNHKEKPAEVISFEVQPVEVNTDAAAYSRFGWLIVLVGFVGFLMWALLAPLDKGVPMSGHVMKASNRQAVQHQTGGTVRELLVRDGSVVKEGQVLVRLDPTYVKSQLDVSQVQYLIGRAVEARLIAERDGAAQIKFPQELQDKKSDPRIVEVMTVQGQLFQSRRSSLQSELAAMEENMAGVKSQIQATKESLESKKQQAELLKEQLGGMRDLAAEGYVARNRLLDLERTYAQVNGSISEDIGSIGRLQRQVLEVQLRAAQRRADYQKEVQATLTDVKKEADSVAARMTGQRHELESVEVKAPASGTVVGLAVFTEGAVVAPGFRMMDIIPANDALVAEGRLPVHLVDKVHKGLPVELNFSAFNSKTTPHISGEVLEVAADRSVDERTGEPYYITRVGVTPEGAKIMAEKKLNLQSGMPVDLFVKTGERTMMNYLLKPLTDRAHNAMREE